jgi:hypothetical protein
MANRSEGDSTKIFREAAKHDGDDEVFAGRFPKDGVQPWQSS